MTRSALAAFLTFAALPPIQWSFLSLFCLVPWISAAKRSQSATEAGVNAFIFGTLYSACDLEWMRSAFSGGSQGDWGPYSAVWALTSTLIGTAYAISGSSLWTIQRLLHIPVMLLFPVVVVASESIADFLLRSCGGTTLDPIRIGLTQVDIPGIRSLAEFGGAAGLGAFVALTNSLALQLTGMIEIAGAAARGLPNASRRWPSSDPGIASVSCTWLLFFLLILLGSWRSWSPARSEPMIDVLLVPSEFGRDEFAIDERIVSGRPQLIVWPENAYARIVQADNCVPLQERARRVACAVLVGASRSERSPPKIYNSAVLIDEAGNWCGAYDKRFLGPGEEVPLPICTWLNWRPVQSIYQFNPGSDASLLTLAPNVTMGVGICHDICFPEWTDQICRLNPSFVAICGSESFDASGRMSKSLLALARVRAIELRKSIVRCTACGESGLITADGIFIPSAWPTPALASVRLIPNQSARATWGPPLFWITMLSPLLTFAVFGRGRKNAGET